MKYPPAKPQPLFYRVLTVFSTYTACAGYVACDVYEASVIYGKYTVYGDCEGSIAPGLNCSKIGTIPDSFALR